MPWPDMLVSDPSKMGEVSGLVAHRPQSQYCEGVSVYQEQQECRSRCIYRLSSVVSTLCSERLLVCPGVVSVP
jgi:hypothetical protein